MIRYGKRVLALILVIAMGFAMVGCSSSTKKTEGTNAPSSNAEDKESALSGSKDQEFYMVTFMSGFSYWKQCYRGFEDAAEVLGVTPLYGGSTEYDLNQALTEFEQIVATKPDGIAVTCMDPDAYQPVIDKAIEQGITVVTFDIDSPQSDRLAYIGTDDYAAGATAAHFIAEELGGKGKVGAMTNPAQQNISERTDGYRATFEEFYPDIEVVEFIETGTDETEAANNAASLFINHPDIDYMLCTTVIASSGAQQASKEAGLEDQIKIIAWDTDSVTLDAIRDKKVVATMSQAPWTQGYWSMVYLYMVANDLITSVDDWQAKGYPSIPETANSGTAVVTIDNYENFYSEE